MESWFNVLGWPSSIRSDGGPLFCGPFHDWCQKNNIKHELSAPYNPKSNGLAKSAVKNVKFLLAKCSETGQDPHRALYEWRNIPRTNGYSPAQLLFGRQQYTSVPSLPIHHKFYDVKKASELRDNVHQLEKKYQDQHKSFLPQLSPGDQVLLQNPKTGLWDKQAKVIAIRPDGLSYTVRCEEREFLRSRLMIRSLPSQPPTSPNVLHSAPRKPFSIYSLPVCDISSSSPRQTSDCYIPYLSNLYLDCISV